MRSDAIDQLLSAYLRQPVRVSWQSAIGDSVRGVFAGARLELAGAALLALPFDRMVLEADRFQLTPGLPARIRVEGPRFELSIDQAQVDRWLRRGRAPFELRLTERAIELRIDLAGLPISRLETELAIRGGWFRLRPRRAAFLGLENRLAWLFRAYLPVPRLTPQTRLAGIRHTEGGLCFQLSVDDFEEDVTPGLVERLRRRVLPFGGRIAGRGPSWWPAARRTG